MHKQTAQKNKAVIDEVSSEKHFRTLSVCLDFENMKENRRNASKCQTNNLIPEQFSEFFSFSLPSPRSKQSPTLLGSCFME